MGELAARTIFSNDTGPFAGTGLDTLAKNQGAILELEGAQAPQSKTITDGSISPTAAYVIVDTEGSAAADDLDVISPVLSASENLHDGMIVHLKAADSGRVVTVKNSSSSNGINTYNGSDYILSTTHWLKLQLRSGKWYEVEGRAMETALAAATAAAAAAASTPATTTARGIGRVATSADLVDGATINNGPAFLAAGVHTSVAAAAGKVPVANASGKIDHRWFGTPARLFASFNTSEPDGLLCNGGEYSRTTYADLFAKIGTSFGAGDGITTFNVPDFRGRTIQGASANLKEVLAAGLPNFAGFTGALSADSAINGPFYKGWNAYGFTGSSYATGPGTFFDPSRVSSIYGASTTVQSPAIAANIFIKY
ncbi:phage tail protein [Desulfovibrio sp.]|uniref:phage tail protein n=1 Tax=Desulfovibrio sp. TaxID=885 RepID=UPI003D1375B5